MRNKYLFPVATVAALALAAPTVAAAKPSIGVSNSPSCAGFSFTASQPGDAFTSGRYTVTAQEYDSETITPSGAEQVFTGSVTWGETVNVTIPAAGDYLLWTYRVDSSADGEAIATYGERQLDCRPTEVPEPEPEPEPEEPGDDETPDIEEPETPEVPEAETPEVPTADEGTTTSVVTDETTVRDTTSGDHVEAATPVVVQPQTAG